MALAAGLYALPFLHRTTEQAVKFKVARCRGCVVARSRLGRVFVREPPRYTRVWSLLLPRVAQFCQLAEIAATIVFSVRSPEGSRQGPHTLRLPSISSLLSDRQRAMMVMQARYRESGPGLFLVLGTASVTWCFPFAP